MAVLQPFLGHHLFSHLHYIFHKTKIMTVILMYWKDLNLNWFKSYDTHEKTHQKTQKSQNITFFYKYAQKMKMEVGICILCHNFWPNKD